MNRRRTTPARTAATPTTPTTPTRRTTAIDPAPPPRFVFVSAAAVAVIIGVGLLVASVAKGADRPGDPAPVATPGLPADVTVSRASGLDDGDAIDIVVKAHPGADLYSVRADLCRADAKVEVDFDFGPASGRCSFEPVSPNADGVAAVSTDPGTGEGRLSFRVGVGTSRWNDIDGKQSSLSCGPTEGCRLAVEVGIRDRNFYWSVPIGYSAAAAPKPTKPPVTAGEVAESERNAAVVLGPGRPAGPAGAEPHAAWEPPSSVAGSAGQVPAGPDNAKEGDVTAAAVTTPSAQLSPPDAAGRVTPGRDGASAQRFFMVAAGGAILAAVLVAIAVSYRRGRAPDHDLEPSFESRR
jgi:hypothetical protein